MFSLGREHTQTDVYYVMQEFPKLSNLRALQTLGTAAFNVCFNPMSIPNCAPLSVA
jgi:hypothetical protein